MTIQQAKNLKIGDYVYQDWNEKKVIKWKINGQVKTWKRDSNRIRVPLKYGLYTYGYLTEKNLLIFRTTEKDNKFVEILKEINE